MLIPLKEQAGLARRHSRFGPGLLSRAMAQGRPPAGSRAALDSGELCTLAGDVYTELSFLCCFLRLRASGRGILHARHTPEHSIEDILVSHFSSRFPLSVIVLGSARGTFIGKGGRAERTEIPFESILENLQGKPEESGMMGEAAAADSSPGAPKAFCTSQQTRPTKARSVRPAMPERCPKMDSFAEERKVMAGKTLSDFF